MEMANSDLVAGQFLIAVVVRVCQHRLLGRLDTRRAQVVVHRHVLPGARRRIVQGEIAEVAARLSHTSIPYRLRIAVWPIPFLVLRLAYARRKSLLVVLPVPDPA